MKALRTHAAGGPETLVLDAIAKTGENQKLVTVVLTNGTSLTCTPEHEWYIVDPYEEPHWKKVPTSKLVVGDRLTGWITPENFFENNVFVSHIIDINRISDTYCCTDPILHKAMFNGIVTGQCMEIMNPVKPFKEISDLWRTDDNVEGEVSMCNLGAVNHDLVADNPELHKRACNALLRMIDYCIHYGYYELTHIGYTAKKRMNAAVGVMNTATYMARKHLRFDSEEGLKSVSQFAERHMYFLIESSLELGKEKGNAPWMYKTKWAGYTNSEGVYIPAWMPIDTQNKRLAKEIGLEPQMDWEDLRTRVAKNKGHRFSVLGALMPGESSSKALGASNSVYPVRYRIV